MKRLLAMGGSDLRLTARDPMLLFMAAAPSLLLIMFAYGVPEAAVWLRVRSIWNAEPFYPIIAASVMLLIPLLPGTMAGLLMLDEKDEGLLQVYAVTPLGKGGYFAYRLSIPAAISVCYGAVAAIVARGMANHSFAPEAVGAAVLMVAVQAAITALCIAGFASNKVEGLAMSKLTALPVITPILLLLPEPWQIAAWPVPAYWTAKTLELAMRGDAPVTLSAAAGVVVHAVWGYALFRYFVRKSA
ncbi:hypothetical protein [Paenibacillus alkalitolerans]|uniref:hypothetical protein n=1 Tax=Paenibacillus alkalitolerans TaxID=2799335 RepID=UPI0018F39FBC|nr:hypothetical protein [Paenibacillus alkalitolerans]